MIVIQIKNFTCIDIVFENTCIFDFAVKVKTYIISHITVAECEKYLQTYQQ